MLKPTGNRLIVTEQLETLSSVIQIPDTVRKEREQECIIVAMGPKVKWLSDLKIGDRVLAAIWGGTPVEDGGKTLRLIDDGSILAKME